jgi:diguanylate cyclase
MIATQDSSETSAEILRLALPKMSKHGNGFTPQSYAIWYEYVRGANEELKTDIDEIIKSVEKLSAEQTYELYQQHIVDRAEKALGKARDDIAELVLHIEKKLAMAGDGATSFAGELKDFGQTIASTQSPDQLQAQVNVMMGNVDRISVTMSSVGCELQASQDEIKRLNDELIRTRDEALVDALTQVKNRKAYEIALIKLRAESLQSGKPLSAIMFDIDHFKKINDNYGHLFGDQVIRAVAQAIRANVKGRDLVARYGGEEFIVLLPETPAAGAVAVADQIRLSVERGRIKKRNSEESIGAINVSAGVAELQPGETGSDFVDRADKGLYQAKQSGRNRVCII